MKYDKLFDILRDNGMSEWVQGLEQQVADYFDNIKHGDYTKWQNAIDALPELQPSQLDFTADEVVVGSSADVTEAQRDTIKRNLKQLLPWRKGPFNLFGVHIDSEWRSNLKWSRLQGKQQSLKDKLILDIGCGNGYYGWRMLGEGARYVVGMDPTLLFYMQFAAFKQYCPDANIDLLPFAIQALPDIPLQFDSVFSMGVIYHRRDPAEHLQQLHRCLKPGGELVLETLIIEQDESDILYPDGRYAKMNNVWAIPNVNTLKHWLTAAGFNDIKLIDITKTTVAEQRCTDWMQFESLVDFLDKEDDTKTIEGYPAPIRALLLAYK